MPQQDQRHQPGTGGAEGGTFEPGKRDQHDAEGQEHRDPPGVGAEDGAGSLDGSQPGAVHAGDGVEDADAGEDRQDRGPGDVGLAVGQAHELVAERHHEEPEGGAGEPEHPRHRADEVAEVPGAPRRRQHRHEQQADRRRALEQRREQVHVRLEATGVRQRRGPADEERVGVEHHPGDDGDGQQPEAERPVGAVERADGERLLTEAGADHGTSAPHVGLQRGQDPCAAHEAGNPHDHQDGGTIDAGPAHRVDGTEDEDEVDGAADRGEVAGPPLHEARRPGQPEEEHAGAGDGQAGQVGGHLVVAGGGEGPGDRQRCH